MAEREQSYKKHARWLPGFHFFVMPVLLFNFVWVAIRAFRASTLEMLWAAVVAAALAGVAFLSRIQALTVQDRVIRLEERLRLQRLLPPDLQPHVAALTHRQLIALRFASDAEVSDLVRDIANGRLSTPKEIKMRVKNWRSDWLRA